MDLQPEDRAMGVAFLSRPSLSAARLPATRDDLEKLELRVTLKVYAAVVAGVALIKALDFLIG